MKEGTKLYCNRHETLSVRPGRVFTFANWYQDSKVYFQCRELLDAGNNGHNMAIYDFEEYNPEKHKEAIVVTPELLDGDLKRFDEKYGIE